MPNWLTCLAVCASVSDAAAAAPASWAPAIPVMRNANSTVPATRTVFG